MNNLGNISDIFPHVLNRPFIPIVLDTPLYQFSVYLAIGPEIYVDGLVVVERNSQKLMGRIGCKNILSYIFNKHYSRWLSATADQIMDKMTNERSEIIKIDTPISRVIEFFRKTKFAFTPIIDEDRV